METIVILTPAMRDTFLAEKNKILNGKTYYDYEPILLPDGNYFLPACIFEDKKAEEIIQKMFSYFPNWADNSREYLPTDRIEIL